MKILRWKTNAERFEEIQKKLDILALQNQRTMERINELPGEINTVYYVEKWPRWWKDGMTCVCDCTYSYTRMGDKVLKKMGPYTKWISSWEELGDNEADCYRFLKKRYGK